MKKRGWIILIISVVLVIVLAGALFFTFYYYPNCWDLACFNSKLESCSKTKFVNDAMNGAWEYRIEGKSGNKCEISVEFLQAKVGDNEIVNLEGKSMLCETSYGVIVSPQSDLKNCHGLLKEDMQDLIIKKMHAYLVENLGEVQEGLGGI